MSRINTDRLKLELSRSKRPAMQYVYLIAVGTFCLVIVLKNQFYNRFWEPKYTFTAQFADVKGVTPGVQRVKVAGITVGVVTEAVNKDGRAVLKMQLKKEYGPIYKDAKLRLRPLTPLQDMYINIESRGHKAAGQLDGQTLTARHTVSPVDVSRVLNEFPGATRTRMQVVLDQLGQGLKDNGTTLKWAFGQLSPFLSAAQRTTTVVKDRKKQTARVVTNLHRLTDALAHRDTQLTSLVSAGNATLGALAGVDQQLDSTLREIPPTLDTVRSAFTRLSAAEDQLDPAIRDLGPVAASLETGMKSLQQFSTDARPALVALRPATTRLAPLARDLQPTSVGLRDAFAQLRRQAPAYDRITKQIPPCFPVIGPFFNDTLSVLKFSDTFGTYPRGIGSYDTDVGGATPLAGTNEHLAASCTDGGSR